MLLKFHKLMWSLLGFIVFVLYGVSSFPTIIQRWYQICVGVILLRFCPSGSHSFKFETGRLHFIRVINPEIVVSNLKQISQTRVWDPGISNIEFGDGEMNLTVMSSYLSISKRLPILGKIGALFYPILVLVVYGIHFNGVSEQDEGVNLRVTEPQISKESHPWDRRQMTKVLTRSKDTSSRITIGSMSLKVIHRWVPIVLEVTMKIIPFWTQLHGIPAQYLTRQMIEVLGCSLCHVTAIQMNNFYLVLLLMLSNEAFNKCKQRGLGHILLSFIIYGLNFVSTTFTFFLLVKVMQGACWSFIYKMIANYKCMKGGSNRFSLLAYKPFLVKSWSFLLFHRNCFQFPLFALTVVLKLILYFVKLFHPRSKSTSSSLTFESLSWKEAFNKCKDVRSQWSINMKSTLFLRTRLRTNWYRVNFSKHVTDAMDFSCTIWKAKKAMPIGHTHRIKGRRVEKKKTNNIQCCWRIRLTLKGSSVLFSFFLISRLQCMAHISAYVIICNSMFCIRLCNTLCTSIF